MNPLQIKVKVKVKVKSILSDVRRGPDRDSRYAVTFVGPGLSARRVRLTRCPRP